MVRGKSALSNDARIHLANFLRCNGEVPLASNARAAAMRERARERLATRNGRRTGGSQVLRL